MNELGQVLLIGFALGVPVGAILDRFVRLNVRIQRRGLIRRSNEQ